MTVLTEQSGQHSKKSPVFYIPGPERFHPPVQEYPAHVPAFDVAAKRTQMDMLLSQSNAAPVLREQVYGLLDKVVADPRDATARGELNFLQTCLSATAEDNEAREASPIPLVGHDRELAEAILHEQLSYPHGHDEQAIAVLRGALAIGEPAVQAMAQPHLYGARQQPPDEQYVVAEASTLAVQNMAELANHR